MSDGTYSSLTLKYTLNNIVEGSTISYGAVAAGETAPTTQAEVDALSCTASQTQTIGEVTDTVSD